MALESPIFEPTREVLATEIAGYPLGVLALNGLIIVGGAALIIGGTRWAFNKALGKQ